MTIKKRLFLSNILMLVMPIILTMLMFSCAVFILMGVTGIKDMRYFREGNVFYGAINEVDDLSENINLADFQGMQYDIDKFNSNYNNFSIVLSVYEENTLLYPSFANTSRITQIVLSEENNYLMINGSNAVYGLHIDKYTLILTSNDFSFYKENPYDDYFYIGIFLFIFSIIIVFIVNRILTRFVSQRITKPIELLVSGVHELRDGNLDFHIEYKYNDEFKAVCGDFNEMAQRLYNMVTARQKDENSRKELIAGISHDLRTPLTSIKAYIEGIEKGVASNPQTQKRYIDTIKGKTEELEHIINQLFLFSKLDIGEFPLKVERIEINTALNSFLAETANEYENDGLSVSFAENSNELYADIDVLQFRNVLHNILGNSVKYKGNDGVMSKIICGESDGNIVISLTDNGRGVPDESLDKLFDVFYRDDVSRKDPSNGSGLGLAITRKIIERLKGTIYAENAPNGGLAIIITLPKTGGAV